VLNVVAACGGALIKSAHNDVLYNGGIGLLDQSTENRWSFTWKLTDNPIDFVTIQRNVEKGQKPPSCNCSAVFQIRSTTEIEELSFLLTPKVVLYNTDKEKMWYYKIQYWLNDEAKCQQTAC
jgi:hypothetical protein